MSDRNARIYAAGVADLLRAYAEKADPSPTIHNAIVSFIGVAVTEKIDGLPFTTPVCRETMLRVANAIDPTTCLDTTASPDAQIQAERVAAFLAHLRSVISGAIAALESPAGDEADPVLLSAVTALFSGARIVPDAPELFKNGAADALQLCLDSIS